jgi:non-heme chloroperoxidase
MAGLVRAFLETDFRPDLTEIRVPTLVIHGSSDATVPLAKSGQRAAAMIQGAALKVYDGAPHGLFLTEKDRLNQDLLAFINGSFQRFTPATSVPDDGGGLSKC